MKVTLRLIMISIAFFCHYFNSNAQSFADFARTFSETNISGTARIQAIGGTQTSLGGDVSSILSNPAGLGFYNKSEFSVSPSINFHNATSEYLGNSLEDNKNNFNFANIGIVINKTKDDVTAGKWRGGSFGISFSRIDDFHNTVTYEGLNTSEDFIDFALDDFIENQNSVFGSLAFNTFLIDEFFDITNTGDTIFFIDRNVEFPTENFPVRQRETITTEGATYQTTVAYGGNYDDKFYFGANIGFTSLDYEQERLYREFPSEAVLNNFVLRDIREINGSGFNLGVGLIFRPVNEVTIGFSYESPTFYNIEDASAIDLFTDFDSVTFNDGVTFAPFDFDLRTPSRFKGGLTYFFGKSGFISADVEFLDYSKNHFNDGSGFLDGDNNEIDNTFQSAVNYSIGGEYRYDIFRFRAGYAYYDDPIEGIDDLDRSRQSISAGLGFKLKRYFVDFAVVNTWFDSSIRPYPGAPLAITDNNTTNAMLTFGLNF